MGSALLTEFWEQVRETLRQRGVEAYRDDNDAWDGVWVDYGSDLKHCFFVGSPAPKNGVFKPLLAAGKVYGVGVGTTRHPLRQYDIPADSVEGTANVVHALYLRSLAHDGG